MKLKMFQVDAFANHVFEGNPAAVCPLEAWLDDSLLLGFGWIFPYLGEFFAFFCFGISTPSFVGKMYMCIFFPPKTRLKRKPL